jgi:hypothetical protein
MNATLKPIVSFSRVRLRDCCPQTLGRKAKIESHLLAADAWLCRAQDASSDGGASYGYSLRGGWRPSYPETSGYIATTSFRLGRDRKAPGYTERAHRILSWLLSVQNADGSFSNPRYGKQGIVFDTGQVLFGLIKGYEVTEDRE